MGNFFNKKKVWLEELETIRTEVAALDKRKCKMLNYEKMAKDICSFTSVSSLIIAFILLLLSLYVAALGLVGFAVFCYGCRVCMSNIFIYLAQCEEERIIKFRSDKEKLVKKIKKNVTYDDATLILAGHDSEIDHIRGANLNLKPLSY